MFVDVYFPSGHVYSRLAASICIRSNFFIRGSLVDDIRTEDARKQAHEQLRHAASASDFALFPSVPMAMNMRTEREQGQQLPSPLRLLELHAVDLADGDSVVAAVSSPSSSSSSTATTITSSKDEEHAQAHMRKTDAKIALNMELGLQEEQLLSQDQQQHLTSYVQYVVAVAAIGGALTDLCVCVDVAQGFPYVREYDHCVPRLRRAGAPVCVQEVRDSGLFLLFMSSAMLEDDDAHDTLALYVDR